MSDKIKQVTEKDIEQITGVITHGGGDSWLEEASFAVNLEAVRLSDGYIGISFGPKEDYFISKVHSSELGIDIEQWTEEEFNELFNVLSGRIEGKELKETALVRKPVTDIERLKTVAGSIFRLRAIMCGKNRFGKNWDTELKLLKHDAKELLEICNEIESRKNNDVENDDIEI